MRSVKSLYNDLAAKAVRSGQAHIFNFWEMLNDSQRKNLLGQAASIDLELMQKLFSQYIRNSHEKIVAPEFEPIQPVPIPKSDQEKAQALRMQRLGEQYLREGKVGAILVAGGQGSRLGFDGPKGLFPIGPVTRKSLFQLHAEKIFALSRRYETRIPWYIMTNELNHEDTRQFFQEHQYFGLNQQEIFFFVQGMIPALDEQGKLILDRPDHIFMSPDGHGGVIAALSKSGALKDMSQKGIEQLFYFQVDNVLTKVCDPIFLGYHIHAKADMSAKVCPKRDPFEKVGVVGKIDGRLGVIEYSDMSKKEKTARDQYGNLRYNTGNIAIHVLSRKFIEQIANQDIHLPWHVAHKKVPFVDEKGKTLFPAAANGYKFEKFIFDALQYAKKSIILEVERSEEFSPIKNGEGEDSPATARRDMTRQFARWLQDAGFKLPVQQKQIDALKVEISPLYALDRDEFLAKVGGILNLDRALYLG